MAGLILTTLSDWDTNFIIAQVLGFFALICSVVSYQQKKKRGLLLFLFFTGLFYAISYLFLNEIPPIFMNILCMTRAFVYGNDDKKWASNKRLWVSVFCLGTVGIGLYIFFGTNYRLYDFLPIISIFVANFSLSFKKTRHLRIAILLSDPLWLIYDLEVKQYFGVVNEAFIILSLLISLVRFDLLPRFKKKSMQEKIDKNKRLRDGK